MNDTLRHFVGLAIAFGGFAIGLLVMFLAGWRPPRVAGTKLGTALGGFVSFAEAAGRWRRSPSAGINPGRLGTAGMLAVGIATAIAAVALQRVGPIVLDIEGARGLGMVFLRDLVRAVLSPGVLSGVAIGLYARRMARHLVAQTGTHGQPLHDAVMVPAVLSILAAAATATTARLAAAAAIPAWLGGKPLPTLPAQLEWMLFNLAAGIVVAVMSLWSGSTGRTIGQLGKLYVSWWAAQIALSFAFGWMHPVSSAILGRKLAAVLRPEMPSLVWIGVYCSVIAATWIRTDARSATLGAPPDNPSDAPGTAPLPHSAP